MAHIVVDAKGLTCPDPVLRTKKALMKLETGQMLKVIATDVASKADIPALVQRLGDKLVELKEADGEISFFIKKS